MDDDAVAFEESVTFVTREGELIGVVFYGNGVAENHLSVVLQLLSVRPAELSQP